LAAIGIGRNTIAVAVPHDVYDRWTELFGDGIDAFYPVLRTGDIGNIGTICCSDGEYPEALPMTQVGMEPGGTWLLQNRAHAHFNNVYMVCPNVGPVYVHPQMEHPYDIAGGNSHIVDYQGNVLGHTSSGANTFVAGIIDIEALRQFRTMNLNSNWMKDLRTEIFRRMYDEPIHPKNLWLKEEPLRHAEVDEVYRANIERLVARGRFTRPSRSFPGARYIPGGESPTTRSGRTCASSGRTLTSSTETNPWRQRRPLDPGQLAAAHSHQLAGTAPAPGEGIWIGYPLSTCAAMPARHRGSTPRSTIRSTASTRAPRTSGSAATATRCSTSSKARCCG